VRSGKVTEVQATVNDSLLTATNDAGLAGTGQRWYRHNILIRSKVQNIVNGDRSQGADVRVDGVRVGVPGRPVEVS
jgi:hypothetical protein